MVDEPSEVTAETAGIVPPDAVADATSDHAVSAPQPAAPERAVHSARWRLVDFAVVVVLVCASFPLRWHYATGDLWTDEADYAFAGVRGVSANAWDRSDSPDEPAKMLRLRHYHPPLVAYAAGAAAAVGPADRTLRIPFVAAGCATVGLLYLCGVSLFGADAGGERSERVKGRRMAGSRYPALAARIPALACAVVLLATPAHLRASSHALPWAFITLWLVAMLWTLLEYARNRHPGWLAATGAALGAMFVSSEYFFPALLAVLCAAPFLIGRELRDPGRRRALAGAAGGGLACLAIGLALWPAGIVHGHAITMLRHYTGMANESWPVNVGGRLYERAPKSAYVVWYWQMYRSFAALYALGAVALIVALATRRLRAGGFALLAFTVVVLIAAHMSHIIGPEYLVHALPLLTLGAGAVFSLLGCLDLRAGAVVAVLACWSTCRHYDPSGLSGMDARARHPRWPSAAAFIASQWQAGDQMLAPVYGGVGRWYLLHVAGVQAHEWQVQGYPAQGEAMGQGLLRQVTTGAYRWAAVGSTFSDTPSVNPRLAAILDKWPIVWQSDEAGEGPSRLLIYQLPRGVTTRTPLAAP